MNTQLSDIDLSQKLTRISRKVKSLIALIPSNPSVPNDYVEKARIEAEIANLTDEQTDIGKELLERDVAAEKRKVKQLEAKATTGAEKAAELLERLPEFADKISVAFKVLGEDYAELLELSKDIRQINMALLNANQPQCVLASVKIEPNALHKLLKEQFRASFGVNTTDVFLPQNTNDFDIVEFVAGINKSCIGDHHGGN